MMPWGSADGPAPKDCDMFEGEELTGPESRSNYSDQKEDAWPIHNLLTDLETPLVPQPVPFPALLFDGGPSEVNGEQVESRESRMTDEDDYEDMLGDNLHVGGRESTAWQDTGFSPQCPISVQAMMPTDCNQQDPRAGFLSAQDQSFRPSVDQDLPSVLQPRLHGIASSEHIDAGPGLSNLRADPWTPENSVYSHQPQRQNQQQQWYGPSPLPTEETSHGYSSVSQPSSWTSGPSLDTAPRTGDSIATATAQHLANNRIPDTGYGYGSWMLIHQSSNGVSPTRFVADRPMLSSYVSDTRPETLSASGGFAPPTSPHINSPNEQDPRYLIASDMGSDFDHISGTPSTASGVSSIPPDPANCEVCGKAYKGEYRRGNLARHKRQKHGSEEQIYPCEESGCRKKFKRQDARLKHYRRRHRHLAGAPLIPRKN